jgi:hypothetical protein
MRTLAGPDARVHFTYLSKPSSESLDTAFAVQSQNSSLAASSCHREGVLDLMKNSAISIDKVCLLDPKAERELSPEDGDSFEWFLFGVRSLWYPRSAKSSHIQRGSSVNHPACSFNWFARFNYFSRRRSSSRSNFYTSSSRFPLSTLGYHTNDDGHRFRCNKTRCG